MITDKDKRHAAYLDIFSNPRCVQFTGDQLDEMKSLYESGVNANRISDKFGIDPCAVRRRLLAMGVKMRPGGRRPMFTDDQCAAMLADKINHDMSNRALGKKYGCSGRAVADSINRAKLKQYA